MLVFQFCVLFWSLRSIGAVIIPQWHRADGWLYFGMSGLCVYVCVCLFVVVVVVVVFLGGHGKLSL